MKCSLPLQKDDDISGDVGMETITRPNNVACSESILSKASVVQRLFKMANHATKEDRMMAKYPSSMNGKDDWNDCSPPLWEEEQFVTCASLGDEDGDDEEASFAESVRIIDDTDGKAKTSSDALEQFVAMALRNRDDFCTDDMDMICIAKDDVMEEASQILMDSSSWGKLTEPERDWKEPQKSRFRWLKNKSKSAAEPDEAANTNTVSSDEQQQQQQQQLDGMETMLCGACVGDDYREFYGKTKKHSSSWMPRMVRRTRLNKKDRMMKKMAQAEQAATGVDVQPLINENESSSSDEVTAIERARDAVDMEQEQVRSTLSTVDEAEAEKKVARTIKKQIGESSCPSRDKSIPEYAQENVGFESIMKTPPPDNTKTMLPGCCIEDFAQNSIDDLATELCNKFSANDKAVDGANDNGEDIESIAALENNVRKAAATSIGAFMKKVFSKSLKSNDTVDVEDVVSTSASVQSASKSVQASINSITDEDEGDAISTPTSVNGKNTKHVVASLKSIPGGCEKSVDNGENAEYASVKSASTEAKKNAAAKSISKFFKKAFTKLDKDMEKIKTADNDQDANLAQEPEKNQSYAVEMKAEDDVASRLPAVKDNGIKDHESNKSATASVKSCHADTGIAKNNSDEILQLVKSTPLDSTPDDAKLVAAVSNAGFVKSSKESKTVEKEEATFIKSVTPTSSLNMSRCAPSPPRFFAEEEEMKAKGDVDSSGSFKAFFDKKASTSVTKTAPFMVDKGTQTDDPLHHPLNQMSPDHVGQSKRICEEAIRRTVSEDYARAEDEEDDMAPASKLGFLNLRRISSDVPKTDLSKNKHKMKKDSKPFEITGHLSQPCPSDITDGTGDEEGGSILKTVKSHEMETIDESKVDRFGPTDISQPSSEVKTRGKNDAKPVDASKEKSEGKAKSGGVTFGSSVRDHVIRRISSDAVPGQKGAINREKQLDVVAMQKPQSELPKDSAAADEYFKDAMPLTKDNSEEASVSAGIDRSIVEEKPQSNAESSHEEDVKKPEHILLQAKDGSVDAKDERLFKTLRSSVHIPAKNFFGSIGLFFGPSKRHGYAVKTEPEVVATCSSASGNSVVEESLKEAAYAKEEAVQQLKKAKAPSSAETKDAEEPEKKEHPEQLDKDGKWEAASSNLSSSTCDDEINEMAVLKNSNHGLKFWKRKSSPKKNPIKEEHAAESKYDSCEENSRGGGSDRDGPASDKDSASGRKAMEHTSQTKNNGSLLMKLKKIDVPEVSNPRFERPLSQEEGLKRMHSMRMADPALVEKCLDSKLKPLDINDADTVTGSSKKSKKRALESILKKNNRFSGAWRRIQQQKEQELMTDEKTPEVAMSLATVYGRLAAGADEDGIETGFEISDDSGFQILRTITQ